MSNVITNLKVRFGADSSKFKKGMNEGKQSMKSFKKQGTGYFKEFAQAFGVNVDAIQQKTEAFNSGLATMKTGMKGAATGSGILTKALKFLKVAMVSTGIGALVAALGSLVAYFTKTKKGSDLLKQAMDAIGAVFSVIVDRASDLGEAIVTAFQNPKDAVKDLWNFIKSQFVNRIAAIPKLIQSAWNIVKGIFDGGAKDAAKDFGQAMAQLTTGFDENQQKKVANGIKGIGREMATEAKAAAELRKRLQELETEEINLIEINSEREKQIEALREKSKRLRYEDVEEARKAVKEAMNIEQARLEDELRIARERANVIEQQKALGKNLREDDRELAEAKANVNRLETQSLKLKRRLTSEMVRLNREFDRQNEKMRENEMAIYDQIEAAGKLQSTGGSVDPGSIDTSKLAPMPDLDTSRLKESASEVESTYFELGQSIEETLEQITINFATTMGELAVGAASFNDISKAFLTPLADLAIKVGTYAIRTGIAIQGIRMALSTLHPAFAIAAGTALVALGSAMKASLSNAADGVASGGSISSAGGGGTQTFDARPSNFKKEQEPVNIRVSGEFKQRGSDLVAAIDETNYRKRIRT